MKKVIVIAVLGVLLFSCGSKQDDPTPVIKSVKTPVLEDGNSGGSNGDPFP